MPKPTQKTLLLIGFAAALCACSKRTAMTTQQVSATPTPTAIPTAIGQNAKLTDTIPMMPLAAAKVFSPDLLQPGLIPGDRPLRLVTLGLRGAGGRHTPSGAGTYGLGILDRALYNILVASRVTVNGYTGREAMVVARHKADLSATGTPKAEMFRGARLRKENGSALVEIVAANGGPLKATVQQQFDAGQILSSTAVAASTGALALVAYNGTLAAYFEGEIVGVAEDPNPNEAPGYFGLQALSADSTDLPDLGETLASNLDRMPAAVTLFQDRFDKGEGQTLKSPWLTISGGFQVSGGSLTASTPSVATVLSGNPDAKNRTAALRNVSVTAVLDLSAGSGGNARVGVLVRENLDTVTSTPRYLNAFLRRTSTGTYEAAVEVVRNGTATALGAPVPAPHFSGRGTLEVRAVERTLRVFVDGEYLLSVDVPTTADFPQSGAFGCLIESGKIDELRAEVVR